MPKPHAFPQIQPKSRKAWRAWLAKNHASSPGIWLVYAKKHTGIPSLTYADAVEEALCYGWIDSLVHPIDDSLYRQIFTPRKEKSAWSALNKQRVERLIASRKMTAVGMKMIELAKTNGRWDAHAATDALTMPPELKKALNANAAAKKMRTSRSTTRRTRGAFTSSAWFANGCRKKAAWRRWNVRMTRRRS